SNFLNVELIGTKIITMEDFYKMKEEEFFLKSKLPLYLYSFNYVDEYTMKLLDRGRISILNTKTNKDCIFDISKYIHENIIFRRDIFELNDIRDDDLKYKINGYNIEVYLSGELEKIVKHLFENKFDVEYGFYILFIKPIFEIVFSSNYVKEEFNTKIESSEYRESLDSFNEILMKYLENEINFKEVWKKYIDELFKKLNVQKLLIHKKIESLISSYDKKISDDCSMYSKVFEQYKKNVVLDKVYYSEVYKYSDNLIKVFSEDVWNIMGYKKYNEYFTNRDDTTLKITNLYIGQSFGTEGNRNVIDRIGKGHEKLQEIMTYQPENRKTVLIFYKIQPDNIYITNQYGKEAVSRLKRILEQSIPNKEYIDLSEISLITFFKPEYNKQHVNEEFNSLSSSKIKNLAKENDGIIIYLNFKDVNYQLISEGNTFFSAKPYLHCVFNKDILNMDKVDIENFFKSIEVKYSK
ncbi:hypothetical protein, partial [Staphylococcus aureus]